MKHVVIPNWLELNSAAMWGADLETTEDNPVTGGAFFPVDLVSSHSVAELKSHRQTLTNHSDLDGDSATLIATEGVHVELRAGACVLTHNYYEETVEVHMSVADLVRLLDWRLAIVDSEDFTNPKAVFESIELDLEVREE